MKKSKFAIAIINVILLVTLPILTLDKPQQVDAAIVRGYVKTRAKKKIQLYQLSGKRSKYYAVPKRKYSYTAKKKIGKKKRTAYKIGNNSHWILAKDVKVVKKAKTSTYVTAHIELPEGYTKQGLLKAYRGTPSDAFVKASMQGMKINDFSRIKAGENETDDQVQVDLSHPTPEQIDALTVFALRIINEARSGLDLMPWQDSSGTRKLAEDIAAEYTKNGKTIRDSHYVPGIIRACKDNGLNFDDNYVEDMAGFYNQSQLMSMTELKKSVYFGIKQMIFGYVGSGENGRNDRNAYQEWAHAGDLFNTQGSLHDGDYNYFGFSISHTESICSLHFISVPTYIVKDPKYNIGFKP